MSEYHVKVMDPTTNAAREFIAVRLAAFNEPFLGREDAAKVVLGIDTPEGDLVAGLFAVISYHVMAIELLWVQEDVRGKGLGRRLVEQAERIARHSGCTMMHLDTFDFQAPSFYRAMGFEQWGVLGPYPNGHQRHFYRKLLERKA